MENRPSRFSDGQLHVEESRPDDRKPLLMIEREAAKREWMTFMTTLTDYCFIDCVKPPFNEETMTVDEKTCFNHCIR